MDRTDPHNADLPSLAALERAIARDLEREHGVVASLRGWSRPRRLVLLAVLIAVEALAMVGCLRRLDWADYPVWRMVLTAGGFAAAALVLSGIALRPIYLRPLPGWAERTILGAAITLPFAVALLPALPTAWVPGFSHPTFALRCFAYATGLATVVILLARALDRGGHSLRASAVAAAVAGGYAGLLGLQLQCPINDPVHLLTGHAPVPVALALGYWVFQQRRKRPT